MKWKPSRARSDGRGRGSHSIRFLTGYIGRHSRGMGGRGGSAGHHRHEKLAADALIATPPVPRRQRRTPFAAFHMGNFPRIDTGPHADRGERTTNDDTNSFPTSDPVERQPFCCRVAHTALRDRRRAAGAASRVLVVSRPSGAGAPVQRRASDAHTFAARRTVSPGLDAARVSTAIPHHGRTSGSPAPDGRCHPRRTPHHPARPPVHGAIDHAGSGNQWLQR